MKIECYCGEVIVDQTDCLSNKGYIIPDQEWFNILDAIDDAIEKSGPNEKDKESACMEIRKMLDRLSKTTWQCSNCGSLYVSKLGCELDYFQVGMEDTSKNVLSSNRKKSGDA